jgi:hypothetical protein
LDFFPSVVSHGNRRYFRFQPKVKREHSMIDAPVTDARTRTSFTLKLKEVVEVEFQVEFQVEFIC